MRECEELPEVSEKTSLELKKQAEEHQFQLAIKTIDAKLADNEKSRSYIDKFHTRATWLFGFVSLCLLIFGLGALYLDKEDTLMDIFKNAMIAFGGGGLGYAAGSRKRDKQK